jgi:hypothetical protein
LEGHFKQFWSFFLLRQAPTRNPGASRSRLYAGQLYWVTIALRDGRLRDLEASNAHFCPCPLSRARAKLFCSESWPRSAGTTPAGGAGGQVNMVLVRRLQLVLRSHVLGATFQRTRRRVGCSCFRRRLSSGQPGVPRSALAPHVFLSSSPSCKQALSWAL